MRSLWRTALAMIAGMALAGLGFWAWTAFSGDGGGVGRGDAPPAEPAPAAAEARQVDFGPVPAFVREVAIPDPADASAAAEHGLRLLALDNQQDHTGSEPALYTRIATHASTTAAAAAAAQFRVQVDPRYQTLTLHHADVIRAGSRESREGRVDIDFIRQEQHLDYGVISGIETVLMRIEDVRSGDVVDVAYTISGGHPLLETGRFAVLPLQMGVAAEQVSGRVVWNGEAALRLYGDAPEPRVERSGRLRTYVWPPAPAEKAEFDMAAAPGAEPAAMAALSGYDGWGEVARWAEPFYRLGETAPEVEQLARRIAAEHAGDYARLVAALEFVQDEVRYFAAVLGEAGYVPASPSATLRTRTGDCKAKSLLLLALLDALGVEAHAALVNPDLGVALDGQPAAPEMFNHVIVQARIGAESFWLEPAGMQERGDLHRRTQPDYGYALVLDGRSTELVSMQTPRPSLPVQEVLEVFDFRSGPTRYGVVTTSMTLRGEMANMYRASMAATGESLVQDALTTLYRNYMNGAEPLEPVAVEDDPRANVLTTTGRFLIGPSWGAPDSEGKRWRRLRAHALNPLLPPLDGPRDTPVWVVHPFHVLHEIEVLLPGEWEFEDDDIDIKNDAFSYSRSMTYQSGALTLRHVQRSLAASAVPTEAMLADAERMNEEMIYRLWWDLPEAPDAAADDPAGREEAARGWLAAFRR
ncbi:DUF3857 domain-containing protein [Glycocaulis profundi]|nr:DUF3857 domain-containing protein [Glycocaulis profundi]